ncbi:hypothetical protein BD769DRAFT_1389141 [Suillus cothurnatus]|nr:hypothetical protein BD769DRAFT_1389141 [Suillus cothurnatus]
MTTFPHTEDRYCPGTFATHTLTSIKLIMGYITSGRNDGATASGLTASLSTKYIDRENCVAYGFDAGTAGFIASLPHLVYLWYEDKLCRQDMPSEGLKQSGIGHELSEYALEKLSLCKWCLVVAVDIRVGEHQKIILFRWSRDFYCRCLYYALWELWGAEVLRKDISGHLSLECCLMSEPIKAPSWNGASHTPRCHT